MHVDLKKAKDEAKAEVQAEKFEIAKEAYKGKLEELAYAEKVVSNVKRELQELDIELEDE